MGEAMPNSQRLRGSYLAFSAVPSDEWSTPHLDAIAHLYVAAPDGSDLHRLTTQNDDSERDPKWSPDGSMVVYETERARDQARAIYYLALDALSPMYLTEGIFPRWMPDAQSILYLAGKDEPWTWEVIDIRSRERQRLFTEIDLNRTISYVAVSPDGAVFAIRLWDEDFGFRLVTPAGQTIEECAPSSRYVESPVWSPKGIHIAFSAADDEEGIAHGIRVLTRATGDVGRISGRAYEAPFVWSPDGEHLALVDDAGPHIGLYILHCDGSGRRHLLDLNTGGYGEGYAPPPTWPPEGRYLAVKTLTTTTWEIVIYDTLTGQIAHRLAWVPDPFMDMSDPVWQP